ncbi:MAG: FtsX-like permease family protein [Planctomycetota bacterium]
MSFSTKTLIKRTLVHRWLLTIAVVIGVAIATTVVTGALLVGDSMRGSLRALTIERLGDFESMIVPGGFFDIEGLAKPSISIEPLMYFPTAVIETTKNESIVRSGGIQVFGYEPSFWKGDHVRINGKQPTDDQWSVLADDEVILNRSAALGLGVDVDDLVTVRLPVESAVPSDSPLGRRDLESEGLPRLRVKYVIDDHGLGRFALTPSQATPANVYLSRSNIADILDRRGQANLLLSRDDLEIDQLNLDPDDLGLQVKKVSESFEDQTVFEYFDITSRRLLLPTPVVDAIKRAYAPEQVTEVSTYLANAIERDNVEAEGDSKVTIPYSTITSMDSSKDFELDFALPSAEGKTPIVLNSWAAERLGVSIGDQVAVFYYEPEIENGQEIERHFNAFVSSIVPITKPAKPYRRRRPAVFEEAPTIYNDPQLTPDVPGVTDQDSINDWDLPFELQREVSREDDDYWNEYRLTPKAFIPLAQGKALFGSRFGETTGLRLDVSVAESLSALKADLMQSLSEHLEELGWVTIPIRQHQLSASRGTTPFDALFLSLSLFVIVSALLLIAMLFRLNLLSRSQEIGTLAATGWPKDRVKRVLMNEGWFIAAAGSLIGLLGGWLYTEWVLEGLKSRWVGAITVPFLEFHWSYRSLLIGAAAGLAIALLTIRGTVVRMLKKAPQSLLSTRGETASFANTRYSRWVKTGSWAMIGLAVVAMVVGVTQGGQVAAGAFVGGGMMLLLAVLVLVYQFLSHNRSESTESNDLNSLTSLGSLAVSTARRAPVRSTLAIGLMATASFLIVAITAFELQVDDAGIGGFELMAQSSSPLFDDLNDTKVRSEIFGDASDILGSSQLQRFRIRRGQDASCNNLYRAAQPTILGATVDFIERERIKPFRWAAAADKRNPWSALSTPAMGTAEDPIPVILDQNTALWSLQLRGGIGEETSFEYFSDRATHFKVVGLLENSLLQGRLIIGESNFEKTFPDISGYEFFLIDIDDQTKVDSVSTLLEDRFGDVGLDVRSSANELSGLMAVQNTYLRTFQSLGAIGLLLGTIGLAIAQVRSVIERRGELALLRATGFSRGRLSQLVVGETAWLLVLGVVSGVLTAFVAVVPHAIKTQSLPPVASPLIVLSGILAAGFLAATVAVAVVNRMPLVASLRCET